jgi:hypothetical protein
MDASRSESKPSERNEVRAGLDRQGRVETQERFAHAEGKAVHDGVDEQEQHDGQGDAQDGDPGEQHEPAVLPRPEEKAHGDEKR